MKNKIARTTLVAIAVATVCMSAVCIAQADDTCSTAKAAGDWGFSLTGTLFTSSGPVPGAGAGLITADAKGNLSGKEARNIAGGFANETITGTWTVSSDCSAVASFQVFESGTLVRSTSFSFAMTNDLRSFYAVEQSLTLPDGTSVAAVISVEGKRVFSEKRRDE